MMTISDSDFRLIAEKIPLILRAVRCHPDNLDMINAHRRLKRLSSKFARRITDNNINKTKQI